MLVWRIYSEKKDDELNYYEYIQSPEWKAKADAAKERAENRCQLCNVSGFVKRLDAHHNTYERLGKELSRDIIVLCEDCHKRFHENGGKPGNRPELTDDQILSILRGNEVRYASDDPYRSYERGKAIIQHIIDGWAPELYDRLNKINIDILDKAIENSDRREYKAAKESEDWNGCEDEYTWRSEHDYWTGWHGR